MADETKVVNEEKKENEIVLASPKTIGLMMHLGLYKQAKNPDLTQKDGDKAIKERLNGPITRVDEWELKQRDPQLLKDGMTGKEYFEIRDAWDKEHPERVREINQLKKEINQRNRGPLTDNLKRGLKDRGIEIKENMTYREGRTAIYKWAKENPEKEAELQKKYELRKEAVEMDITDKQILGLQIRGIEQTEGMKRGDAAKAIRDFDLQNPGAAAKAYEAYNAEMKKREEQAKAQEAKVETQSKEKAQTKAKPKAKLVSKEKAKSKAKSREMKK